MTLKVLVVNLPENPTDKAVSVEVSGAGGNRSWVLDAGQSCDALIYEGREVHIQECGWSNHQEVKAEIKE